MSTARQRKAEEDGRARKRSAQRKAERAAEEPTACQQCGGAAQGRFCYWCGKRRGLW